MMALKPVPEIQEWLDAHGISYQSYGTYYIDENPEIARLEDEIADLDEQIEELESEREKLRDQLEELYEENREPILKVIIRFAE